MDGALSGLTAWLERFGETSFDHQSYFAGPVGGAAKALYYRHGKLGAIAVAPMILSEAFLPAARRLFWKKQRFPIADAHYAMGFALLAQCSGSSLEHDRAAHFLRVLEATRCPGYRHAGWGYPFDWVTRNGVMKAQTPLITTHPVCLRGLRRSASARRHTTLAADDAVGRRARLHRNTRPGALARRGHLRLQPPRHAVPRRQCQRLPCFPAVQCGADSSRATTMRRQPAAQSQLRAACAASRWVLALCHRRRARLRRSLPYLLRAQGAGQDRSAGCRSRPSLGPSNPASPTTSNTCSTTTACPGRSRWHRA